MSIHRADAGWVSNGKSASLYGGARDAALLPGVLNDGYDLSAYSVLPAPATRMVDEGEDIDIGDRRLEVLHLPGHSPGSIGLWESASRTLCVVHAGHDPSFSRQRLQALSDAYLAKRA